MWGLCLSICYLLSYIASFRRFGAFHRGIRCFFLRPDEQACPLWSACSTYRYFQVVQAVVLRGVLNLDADMALRMGIIDFFFLSVFYHCMTYLTYLHLMMRNDFLSLPLRSHSVVRFSSV